MNKKVLIGILSTLIIIVLALGIYLFVRGPERGKALAYEECFKDNEVYYAFDYANDVDVFTDIDFSHNTIYEDKYVNVKLEITGGKVKVIMNNSDKAVQLELTSIKNPLSVGVISENKDNYRIVILSDDGYIYYVKNTDLFENKDGIYSSLLKKYDKGNIKAISFIPKFNKINYKEGGNPALFVKDKDGEIYISQFDEKDLININLMQREVVSADTLKTKVYHIYAVNKADDLKHYSYKNDNYCYNDYTYFEYKDEVPVITDYFVANINRNSAYEVFFVSDKNELLYFDSDNISNVLKLKTNKRVKNVLIEENYSVVYFTDGSTETFYKSFPKQDEENNIEDNEVINDESRGVVYTNKNIEYEDLDFSDTLKGDLWGNGGEVVAEKNRIIFKQYDNSNNDEEVYDEYEEKYIQDYIVTVDDNIKSIKVGGHCGGATNVYYLTDSGNVYNIEFSHQEYVGKENINIINVASGVSAISIYYSEDFSCGNDVIALKYSNGDISINNEGDKYKRDMAIDYVNFDIVYMYNKDNAFLKKYNFKDETSEYYFIKDEEGDVLVAKEVFFAMYLIDSEEMTPYILGEDDYLYFVVDRNEKDIAVKYSDKKVKSLNIRDEEVCVYTIKYVDGSTEVLYSDN